MSSACCSNVMCCLSLVNGAIEPTKGALSPWQALPYGATLSVGMQGCLGWQRCPELPWLQGKAEPGLWHLLDLLCLGQSSKLFCSSAGLSGFGVFAWFVGNACL